MNQRDAQKLATRRALSAAAIDLFSTKGFDETRVEDIAAAAGVSSRTFFLHFTSKDAAAFPDHDERVAALAGALASAPPDRNPLEVVREQIVVGVRQTSEHRVRSRRYRLIADIEALRHRDVLGDLDYERVIREYLVARWGGGTEVAFRAARIAGVAMAIARAALATWDRDRSFDPAAAADAEMRALS